MKKEIFHNGPVVPIPPSFDENGELDLKSVESYIKFLKTNGIRSFMTTAGTSQFNLLSLPEIVSFNLVCAETAFPEGIILGLPPLANTFVKNMARHIWFKENVGIMLLYPERYYDDETILNYFYDVADESPAPVFIHGLPFRHATKGIYEITSGLVNKLAGHKNIIGMKEENSTIDGAFELCKDIVDDFIIIVAGKSQRRFVALKPAGADTFLAGIGNIFPHVEIEFFDYINENNIEKAYEIVMEYETPLFDVFMKIGWHKALQEALRQKGLCCFYNRQPFPKSSAQEKENVADILKRLENK